MAQETETGRPAPKIAILLLGLYLIGIIVLAIALAVGTWPTCPGGPCSGTLAFKLPLGSTVTIPGGQEARYFYIAICFGAIGSAIHVLTSFADYVGNRKLYLSWFWWLILRTPIGISLAIVFYVVVRAGFLGTTGTDGAAAPMNPYGVAAISAMVGMFSKQATDKLNDVFTTLFKTDADKKRDDKLDNEPALRIEAVDPKHLTAANATHALTIKGAGFANGMKVQIKGPAFDATFDASDVSDKSLKINVTGVTLTAGQKVDLVVFDPAVSTTKSKAFPMDVK